MWGGGSFLLLSLAFFLMLLLPFGWNVSAIIAGAVIVVGLILMIYVTAKSK
jgi:hypothetical protein